MSNHQPVISLDQKKLEKLIHKITSLPQEFQGPAEKAALRAGAVPIRRWAKSFARVSRDTGLLEKSIGLRVAKAKGQSVFCARVGPKSMRQLVIRIDKRTGKKRQEMANPANYSHLVEFGTSHSSAKPYIRPAIAMAKDEVLNAMVTGLEKHLARVAAKMKL